MNKWTLIKIRFARLRQIWLYSDSQPTEILLAICNIFLAPIAILSEVGDLYFYALIVIATGINQIICVAKDNIDCRVKASMFTFGIYLTSAIMYLSHVGFPTPTHYGWVVLVISSFSSMGRVTREKIYRNG